MSWQEQVAEVADTKLGVNAEESKKQILAGHVAIMKQIADDRRLGNKEILDGHQKMIDKLVQK